MNAAAWWFLCLANVTALSMFALCFLGPYTSSLGPPRFPWAVVTPSNCAAPQQQQQQQNLFWPRNDSALMTTTDWYVYPGWGMCPQAGIGWRCTSKCGTGAANRMSSTPLGLNPARSRALKSSSSPPKGSSTVYEQFFEGCLDFKNPAIWAQADALNHAAGVTSNFAGSASDLTALFYPLMTAACFVLFLGLPLVAFVAPLAASLGLYVWGFALVASSPFMAAANYKNSLFPTCTVTVATYGAASGWDTALALLAFLAWCTAFPVVAAYLYWAADVTTPGSVMHPGGAALEVERGGAWLPATNAVTEDGGGLLNVTYADGSVELAVKWDRVRLAGGEEAGGKKSVRHFLLAMHLGGPVVAAAYAVHGIKKALSATGCAVTHTSGRCAHCCRGVEEGGRMFFCTPQALRSHTLARHAGKAPLFMGNVAAAAEEVLSLNNHERQVVPVGAVLS